jgi:hypothetical protein
MPAAIPTVPPLLLLLLLQALTVLISASYQPGWLPS